LNFLYVPREEEYAWLPGLMWAVVLWQSFLGWWWWVGAGSGNGFIDNEDITQKLQREAKRETRRKKPGSGARRRRKRQKLFGGVSQGPSKGRAGRMMIQLPFRTWN